MKKLCFLITTALLLTGFCAGAAENVSTAPNAATKPSDNPVNSKRRISS